MYGKGRSNLDHIFKAFRILVNSQMGYNVRHCDIGLRNTLEKTLSSGKDFVTKSFSNQSLNTFSSNPYPNDSLYTGLNNLSGPINNLVNNFSQSLDLAASLTTTSNTLSKKFQNPLNVAKPLADLANSINVLSKPNLPYPLNTFANPLADSELLGRLKTVSAGVETYAKLIASGVYPGQGGYEKTTQTESKLKEKEQKQVDLDLAEIPTLVGKIPTKNKHFTANEFLPENPNDVVGGLTTEEEIFLANAAKEIGVKDFGNQFPNIGGSKKVDHVQKKKSEILQKDSSFLNVINDVDQFPNIKGSIKEVKEIKLKNLEEASFFTNIKKVVKPMNKQDKNDKEHIAKQQESYKPHIPKDYRVERSNTNIMSTSKESRVPSSRLSRLANFGYLAFGLGRGAAAEVTRRAFNNDKKLPKSNPFLTEANAERFVDTLCRVRGAALKLGQMLSIQDSSTVPAYLLEIFERVRQSADYMPTFQVHRQLETELGLNWRQLFKEFDERPFAAASIGQVHKGIAMDGKEVAIKIQYPGVANGIESDIKNLITILNFGKIFPKGLYLDNFAMIARQELIAECDYKREARASNVFRNLLSDDFDFYVPKVYPELSTKRVLTTEFVVGKVLDACVDEPQSVRDWIGSKYTELCLKEIFIWRFMQTDPNWSNFLFGRHPESGESRLVLLDFGASRSYGKSFVDKYMHIIKAAYDKDTEKILKYSRDIGFLTGYESKIMEKAHIDSIMITGEVLTSIKPYDFGKQDLTTRVQRLIPIMLEHRLTSPPNEVYSLHRKLSGCYLLSSKLKATVSCGSLFAEIYDQYQFGNNAGMPDINIDQENVKNLI